MTHVRRSEGKASARDLVRDGVVMSSYLRSTLPKDSHVRK